MSHPSCRRALFVTPTPELESAARSLAHCGSARMLQPWQHRFACAFGRIQRTHGAARMGTCAACGMRRRVKTTQVGRRQATFGAVCQRKLELFAAFRNAKGRNARMRAFLELGAFVESQHLGAPCIGEDIWEDEPCSSEEEPNTDDEAFIDDDDDVDSDILSDGDYIP